MNAIIKTEPRPANPLIRRPRDPVAIIESGYIPEPNSGCWLWTGTITSWGYGQVWVQGRFASPHRLSLQIASGTDGANLFACHKCDVPLCINPDHLFWGTHADNMRDQKEKGRAGNSFQTAKTHCQRGHEYTPENTRRTSGKYPQRVCIACSRIAGAKYDTTRRQRT